MKTPLLLIVLLTYSTIVITGCNESDDKNLLVNTNFEKPNTNNHSVNLNIEHPVYEAEIKTSGCAVEVLINNISFFSKRKEDGMAINWPINDYISKNRVQIFNIKAKKYPTEETFNKNAKISFKVFVRDAFKPIIRDSHYKEVPKMLVYELPLISFEGKSVQKYTYSGHFKTIIPANSN